MISIPLALANEVVFIEQRTLLTAHGEGSESGAIAFKDDWNKSSLEHKTFVCALGRSKIKPVFSFVQNRNLVQITETAETAEREMHCGWKSCHETLVSNPLFYEVSCEDRLLAFDMFRRSIYIKYKM